MVERRQIIQHEVTNELLHAVDAVNKQMHAGHRCRLPAPGYLPG
jgi:hypothetical protein